MTQQKSPSGRNRKGIKKSITNREYNSPIPVVAQGFEASYPCRGCPYFQPVRLSHSKFRHRCGLRHVWLEASGRLDCSMMKRGGAA